MSASAMQGGHKNTCTGSYLHKYVKLWLSNVAVNSKSYAKTQTMNY